MTNFSSFPKLNLWTAPSTECHFESPSFVSALMRSVSDREFGAVLTGLDKALQLGIGLRAAAAAVAAANSNDQSPRSSTATPIPPVASASSSAVAADHHHERSKEKEKEKEGGGGGGGRKTTPIPQQQNQQKDLPSTFITSQRDEPTFEERVRNLHVPSSSSGSSGSSLPLGCCLNDHPTLSLFGDWLNFCSSQKFSTLQTQNCLFLLAELLDALGHCDPDLDPPGFESTPFAYSSPVSEKQQQEQQQQKEHSSSSPAASNDHHSNNNASSVSPNRYSSSLSPASRGGEDENAGGGESDENNNKFQDITPTLFGGPPECVIEVLKSFLAKVCSRRTILVIDHEKLSQAQALADAYANAQAEANKVETTNVKNKKHHHHPPHRGGGGGAKEKEKEKQQQTAEQQNQQQNQQQSPTFGFDEDQMAAIQSIQQQHAAPALLRDPNPYVKEQIVDPVFTAAEVKKICAFAAETVFQQWRLISILRRAPDGLTVPSEIHVVCETIPVSVPSTGEEGTDLKRYQDTQARLHAFSQAEETLQECYEESLRERNATVGHEFEHTTSVAMRRDRVIREDDMRKQMKGEEFKRTVRVLGKVMEPSVILEQLAKEQMANNNNKEAAAGEGQAASPISSSSTGGASLNASLANANSTVASLTSAAASPDGATVIMTLEQRLARLEQLANPPEQEKHNKSHKRHR